MADRRILKNGNDFQNAIFRQFVVIFSSKLRQCIAKSQHRDCVHHFGWDRSLDNVNGTEHRFVTIDCSVRPEARCMSAESWWNRMDCIAESLSNRFLTQKMFLFLFEFISRSAGKELPIHGQSIADIRHGGHISGLGHDYWSNLHARQKTNAN